MYNGIDYSICEYAGGLKYDWIVQPNAEPSDIKLRLEGERYTEDGRLLLRTVLNEIREERPYAYQCIMAKVEVACRFVWKTTLIV